jgi:hypothetical protein
VTARSVIAQRRQRRTCPGSPRARADLDSGQLAFSPLPLGETGLSPLLLESEGEIEY